MLKKIIQHHKSYPSKSMGPHVRQVIPSAIRHVDPFVFLDHFGPITKQPGGLGVPPHPHAGIATITYLFSGSNRHQDSYGHDAIIQTGDLAWMQAGKGIIHAEGMNEHHTTPEIIHGLQFWISLPAKDKFTEPDFFHYPSASLPSFTYESAFIKVIAGEMLGYVSPVKSLSPAYIFEIKVKANTETKLPLTKGNTCGVYLVDGHITIDEKQLVTNDMALLDDTGTELHIKTSTDSHFIIMGGQALNEPIVAYASFVMNSDEQIKQVIKDYHAGKMGQLTI
jgi:redox-sensitive bicupin YhaK (pirin superfamily)